MQEWISEKERKPDLIRSWKDREKSFSESDFALVIRLDGKYDIAQYKVSRNGEFWENRSGPVGNITHWMPLPEPPKE